MINLNRDERKMDTNEIGSWRKLERVYNCSQEVCNNLTKEKTETKRKVSLLQFIGTKVLRQRKTI